MRDLRFGLLFGFVAMTIVAVSLAAAVWAAAALGIDREDLAAASAGFVVPRTPMMIVWGVGVVLLLARWPHHPFASALGVAAFAGFFIQQIAAVFIMVWSIHAAREGMANTTAHGVYNICMAAGGALSSALLVAALLVQRPHYDAERASHIAGRAPYTS